MGRRLVILALAILAFTAFYYVYVRLAGGDEVAAVLSGQVDHPKGAGHRGNRQAAEPQGDGPVLATLPIAGLRPEELRDTFLDVRREGKRHEALNIAAPRGTPVVAAVPGTIRKLFESEPGGLTIYEFGEREEYVLFYAHLDRYAEGLKEGQTVRAGELIGYVGSTGNAPDELPHLHFAIFRLTPEKAWWKGSPVDPYPLVQRLLD